jgi:hypothetical protein
LSDHNKFRRLELESLLNSWNDALWS